MRLYLPKTFLHARHSKTRWQDWIVLTFAVWLHFSPYLFAYWNVPAALYNALIFSIGIFVVAGWGLSPGLGRMDQLLLGIWLIVSPRLFVFTWNPRATWNLVVIGVLVSVLSGGALAGNAPPLPRA